MRSNSCGIFPLSSIYFKSASAVVSLCNPCSCTVAVASFARFPYRPKVTGVFTHFSLRLVCVTAPPAARHRNHHHAARKPPYPTAWSLPSCGQARSTPRPPSFGQHWDRTPLILHNITYNAFGSRGRTAPNKRAIVTKGSMPNWLGPTTLTSRITGDVPT